MTSAHRPAGARTPASPTSAGSQRADARTGRARARRLFLPLPVLALVAGMLPLFASSPAEAQNLSATCNPASRTMVNDLSVNPKYRLKLTPAPATEAALDYTVLDFNGKEIGRWDGTPSIPTSGEHIGPIHGNTFADYLRAFPTFGGIR